MPFLDNHVPSTQMDQGGIAGKTMSVYNGGMQDLYVGERGFDTGTKRPYIPNKGKYVNQPCVTVNLGGWTVEKGERVPIRRQYPISYLAAKGMVPWTLNATALPKETWLELDTKILCASRYRLTAYKDLAEANSYGGFNGMDRMILEHQTMSDPGEAAVDMDALTEARGDSPLFQLEGLPLPITHSDFWFSKRVLDISRRGGMPLDASLGEAAGRRVSETVEKTTIGVTTGITYGGASTQTGGYGRTSSVYGYTNFSNRLTKTNLTTPTGSNPDVTVSEVLSMIQTLRNQKFYGPFMLYHSNDWDTYMDNDYARLGGANAMLTLRERLRKIPDIKDVKRLDFLFATQLSSSTGPGTDVDATLKPFRLILVQMTSEVARAVNGLDITTIQWESVGGMRINFKVMCIQVPQLRADYYGNCGIMDAATT